MDKITKDNYKQWCEDNFMDNDVINALESLTKIYLEVDVEFTETELIITIPLMEK